MDWNIQAGEQIATIVASMLVSIAPKSIMCFAVRKI